MSKRKLRYLVENDVVSGWDDPRLPTLGGLRRRGYTPASIRNFCDRIGVSKVNSTVDYAFLEHCLREDLNESANRVMAVLRPIKLIIENYLRTRQSGSRSRTTRASRGRHTQCLLLQRALDRVR
jgi:glutaminyl-tRNA synthetase